MTTAVRQGRHAREPQAPSWAGGSTNRYTAGVATRLLNVAATASTLAACLIVAACYAADAADPRKSFLSLSSNCHTGILGQGTDARFTIFNDLSYGPYCGSIITVKPRDYRAFGEVAGIYYRYFRWSDGTTLWTFTFRPLYPLIA